MNATNPYAPPSAEVRDIEGSGIVVASRWSRLGAAFIDTVLAILMIYVPAFVAAGISGGGFDPETLNDPNASVALSLGMFAGALIGAVPYFGLTLYFVLKNRQTIGKKIVGIKVVRKDGSQCSFARIFWLRNVVNILLGFVPLYSIVDILLIFGEDRQCLHDKIADTIVVKA